MKRLSHTERTKCCRTESGRFSLCIFLHSSIASFYASFREARVVLRNARVLPAAPPTCSLLCALTNRHRHLFAGLLGCNRPAPHCGLLIVVRHFFIIYIYSFASLCVGAYSCLLCRRAVSLCIFGRTKPVISLSPFSLALWYKGSKHATVYQKSTVFGHKNCQYFQYC